MASGRSTDFNCEACFFPPGSPAEIIATQQNGCFEFTTQKREVFGENLYFL